MKEVSKMSKITATLGIMLTGSCWAQAPQPTGCVAAPVVPDAKANANQAKMQAIDLNSAKAQKERLVMQQLLTSLNSDAKFQSDKAKMQQHIQSLAADANFQKQKSIVDAARLKIETSPEHAQKVAKFQADAAKACPGGTR